MDFTNPYIDYDSKIFYLYCIFNHIGVGVYTLPDLKNVYLAPTQYAILFLQNKLQDVYNKKAYGFSSVIHKRIKIYVLKEFIVYAKSFLKHKNLDILVMNFNDDTITNLNIDLLVKNSSLSSNAIKHFKSMEIRLNRSKKARVSLINKHKNLSERLKHLFMLWDQFRVANYVLKKVKSKRNNK